MASNNTYTVSYNVNVNTGAATTAINNLKSGIQTFNSSLQGLKLFRSEIGKATGALMAFQKKSPAITINTTQATKNLGKVVTALTIIEKKIAAINGKGVSLRNTTAPKVASAPATPTSGTRTTSIASAKSSNMTPWRSTSGIKASITGGAPIPNNGGMAIDMLKGMGIAYGISGLGSLVSKVVNQAVEYDNLMKSVENILKSHDTSDDFAAKFADMAATVRDVGMETKFTVVEVADAAKFLAMAGLSLKQIKESIRPIADIALIGDTELGQTADVVTNIMTAYNISSTQMRDAADIMANTFTMTNTTLMEIAESFKYSAAILSTGGVKFEEASAAIGVLGDAGVKASQAGTTMRTILANIVNPTKKQAKAWNELGIKRYDSQGNRRDLLDIFKDLNKADVDVQYFYRMFHRTAAAGAAALTAHVNKWQNVYIENLLSSGLSARLADEKKNTLKGLWAQVESVFVDEGVTAFSRVEGYLRSLMHSAIAWLKTDGADKAFKEVSKTLVEFMDIIIDSTKMFANIFGSMQWFIKPWIKFQLTIWPIVKGFQALIHIFAALKALRGIGAIMMTISHGFHTLRTLHAANFFVGSAGAAGATIASRRTIQTIPFLPGISSRQYRQLFSLPGWEKWHNKKKNIGKTKQDYREYRKQKHKTRPKRIAFAQVGNAAAGTIGSAGLGYGMYKLASAENTAGKVAGGLYGLGGAALMIPGPVGWIAGGTLLAAGVVADIVSSNHAATQAVKNMEKLAEQHKVVDGILVNSKDVNMRYLKIQKQYLQDEVDQSTRINNIIRERIALKAKELGIDGDKKPSETPSTGRYDEVTQGIKNARQGTNLDTEVGRALNNQLHAVAPGYFITYEDYGKDWRESFFPRYERAYREQNSDYNGLMQLKDSTGTVIVSFGDSERDIAQHRATQVVASVSEIMADGGYYAALLSDFKLNVGKLALANSAEQLNNYISSFIRQWDPNQQNDLISTQSITTQESEETWSRERMLRDTTVRKILWDNLKPIVDATQCCYQQYQDKINNSQTDVDVQTLTDMLVKVIGGDVGATASLYKTPQSFLGSLGYYNEQWNSRIEQKENGDINSYTADEIARMAISSVGNLLKAMDFMNLDQYESGKKIMDNAQIALTLAYMTTPTDQTIDVAQNPSFKGVDGTVWKYNSALRVYQAFKNNSPVTYPMYYNVYNKSGNALLDWQHAGIKPQQLVATPQQMAALLEARQINTGKDDKDLGDGTNTTDYGTDTKKSLPKQINIHIDSLMNVESIDMTNSNNVETVNRLKQEIAYALVEAAGDGIMMINGLKDTM